MKQAEEPCVLIQQLKNIIKRKLKKQANTVDRRNLEIHEEE